MNRILVGSVFAGLMTFDAVIFGTLIFGTVAPSVFAAKFNRKVSVGDAAPDWKMLQGVDGKNHSRGDESNAKLLVVLFICNHCPTAKEYDARLIRFVKTFAKRGVRVVAISSSRFPADRFEKMKEHAKRRGFSFPYLHDPSQNVGRNFGVTHTPQVFVLDSQRKIAYMGAIDDNIDARKVEEHYLTDAITALLAGKEPEETETRQFGCELKYVK